MGEGMQRPGVDEALSIIRASLEPLGAEEIATGDAFGRVTAAPLCARRDVPAFQMSAMDGFALNSADTRRASDAAPAMLTLAQPIYAGGWPAPLAAGSAAPIATGAPVPEGADAVLVRERAEVASGRLLVREAINPGRNVRRTGEDMTAGREVLGAGIWLAPHAVGALAAFGIDRLDVRRTPRIGLISTGSELSGIGEASGSAGLVDSNAPTIAACAQALGLPSAFLGRAVDEAAAIDLLLDSSGGCDLVISTGGVSAGDLDLVRDRLKARGAHILFHGVRMRPGKPILFARLADGRPYFGLPGNPVAALVGFRFFVMAALRRMLGLATEQGEAVSCNAAPRAGTTLILRGRRTADPGRIDCALDQRSHVLSSMLQADCWVRLGEGGGTAEAFPIVARF
jgi:molybdopterin molybdotransferase